MIYIFKLRGSNLFRFEGAISGQEAWNRLDDPKRWILFGEEHPANFSLTTNHCPITARASS